MSLGHAISVCVFMLENHTSDLSVDGWTKQPAHSIDALSERQDTVRWELDGGIWAIEMSYEDVEKHPEVVKDGEVYHEGWRCEVSHAPGKVDIASELSKLVAGFEEGVDEDIWADVTEGDTFEKVTVGMTAPRAYAYCGTSGWLEIVAFGEKADSPGNVTAIVENTEDYGLCEG